MAVSQMIAFELSGRQTQRSMPGWVETILRIPLALKISGANLIIMVVAVFMLFGPMQLEPDRLTDAVIVVSALAAGAVVNFFLVRLALRPVGTLTQVAWLVSQGLLGARVPASIMADRELMQLSATINGLLDDLVAERDKLARAGR
jgi:HAMP domain-containing protein